MSNKFSSSSATLLFSFALIVIFGVLECKDVQKKLTDLYKIAEKLESVEMLVAPLSEAKERERKDLLFGFIRELKSLQAKEYHVQRSIIALKYGLMANNYFEDVKKGKVNWFTKNVWVLESLRFMRSRSEPFLKYLTDSYVEGDKQIDGKQVDRDMAKFLIHDVKMILFVLATDIKYLTVIGKQFVNSAILDQVKENPAENSGIYELDDDQLSSEQKMKLREFYASLVDTSKVKVGEAIEHFDEPGNFVIGRYLDSCRSLLNYKETFEKLKLQCGDECNQQESEFSATSLRHYENFVEFCKKFGLSSEVGYGEQSGAQNQEIRRMDV